MTYDKTKRTIFNSAFCGRRAKKRLAAVGLRTDRTHSGTPHIHLPLFRETNPFPYNSLPTILVQRLFARLYAPATKSLHTSRETNPFPHNSLSPILVQRNIDQPLDKRNPPNGWENPIPPPYPFFISNAHLSFPSPSRETNPILSIHNHFFQRRTP